MHIATETVAVVLDPEFAEKLRSLAQRCPVGIVSSPVNRMAAEACWSDPGFCSRSSITAFDWIAEELPPDTILRMLDMIELHHPRCVKDEFIGGHLTPSPGKELASLGYTRISVAPHGFSASKPVP